METSIALSGLSRETFCKPRPLAWAELGRPFGARAESVPRRGTVGAKSARCQTRHEKSGLGIIASAYTKKSHLQQK